MQRIVQVLLFCMAVAWAEDTTSFQRYLVVPFAAYAEETGGQFGGMGMLFFRPDAPEIPGGSLVIAGIGTTNGQRMAMLSTTQYLYGGLLHLESSLQYSSWPGDYWSGGNDPADKSWSYNMKSWQNQGSALVAGRSLSILPAPLQKHLHMGIQYDLENNRTTVDYEEDVPAALYSFHENRIGFGPLVQWDSRDQEGGPTKGSLFSLGQFYYDNAWGSKRSFSKTTLDLRRYHSLPWNDVVLGLSALWERAAGDVPFDRLSMPDGSTRMRGLQKGRLRDYQDLVLQSELRIPLRGRFSSVAFVEAGKVGPDLDALMQKQFHYDIGGGLRYAVNPSRKLNFRIDMAWVDGGLGAAASFGEAF